jgi:hypothetical protein
MITLDIDYNKLLALRASRPKTILHSQPVSDDAQPAQLLGYKLAIECGSIVRTSWIDQSYPEWSDFTSRVLPLCDKPIEQKEVRFYTHDWANPWTWNGKTCGDPAAWAAGGVALHPMTGLWVDATGAQMLQSYATPQIDDGAGNMVPNPDYMNDQVLYGALMHHITASYDDVAYKWLDANGNVLAWLDLPVRPTEANPGVWKAPDGSVVTSYDTASRRWKDPDGNDRTSSRWRIDPYEDSLINLKEVGMDLEMTAELPEGLAFRWQAFGLASGAQKAALEQAGLPTDMAYKGVEFPYYTIQDLRFGCNEYTQYNHQEFGNQSYTQAMVYNYTRSVEPVLDARQKQRLDLVMDNHQPITTTAIARGTFLAVQYPSF